MKSIIELEATFEKQFRHKDQSKTETIISSICKRYTTKTENAQQSVESTRLHKLSTKLICLLLNGTSALFRPLVPRIVEVEHITSRVKNDLK